MRAWLRRIERPASFVAGIVVLAWVYDCIPPWPFVTRDGKPVKARRLGMFPCPRCGCMSNEPHRNLCRGPLRREDMSL